MNDRQPNGALLALAAALGLWAAILLCGWAVFVR